MANSANGLNGAWKIVTEDLKRFAENRGTAAEKEDLRRRRSEDFDFLVMCALKGNMGMYDLLRDRNLDKEKT